jgi:hypothetical protein
MIDKNPPAEPDQEGVEMRPEYDFRGGVRGKYAARYRRAAHEIPPGAGENRGTEKDQSRTE